MSLLLDGSIGVIGPVNKGVATATGSTTARNLDSRFADSINVKNFNAVGNGIADDTAAIQAAIAAGNDVFFPAGTYLITSNITISANRVLRFAAGARVTATSFFTLDFNNNASIAAPRSRIFIGQASATNIKTVYPEWWGASHSVTVTQNAEFQAALDAMKEGGEMLLNDGFYCLDGTTPLNISNAQIIRGAGHYHTTIRVNTTAVNVFDINTKPGGSLIDMRIQGTAVPTSGICIDVQQLPGTASGRVRLQNLYIDKVFDGIFVRGNSTQTINTVDLDNITIFGVYNRGAFFEWAENVVVKRVLINCDIGTGGGAPLGCIIMKNKCQSVDFVSCQAINSLGDGLTVTSDASGIVQGQTVRWCYFIGCLFDDNSNGVNLNKCSDLRFTNCWFSSNGRGFKRIPGNGVWLRECENINIAGGVISNNGQRGVRADSNAVDFVISNAQLAGNSINDTTATAYWAVDIFGGASGFSIKDCVIKGQGFGWIAGNSRGIQVRAGASDNYMIQGNLISDINSGDFLNDQGAGTNKIVSDNLTW
jgi:hypothetical protein